MQTPVLFCKTAEGKSFYKTGTLTFKIIPKNASLVNPAHNLFMCGANLLYPHTNLRPCCLSVKKTGVLDIMMFVCMVDICSFNRTSREVLD